MLCLSDVLAMGALFEAPRQGLDVPRDLSVMGFDDLDWAAQIEPSLTTVHLPVARMGEAAARALVAHLDDGEPIRPVEVTGHLVERDSTAGPRNVDR